MLHTGVITGIVLRYIGQYCSGLLFLPPIALELTFAVVISLSHDEEAISMRRSRSRQ